MLSGKCPKCGSSKILVSRFPGGIWNYEQGAIGQEIMASDVEKVFAKGWHTCLCTACGLCEFYLSDQEAIAKLAADPDNESWSDIVPANWYADPAGRHELRYWNGLRWTPAVRDRGTDSEDPHPL